LLLVLFVAAPLHSHRNRDDRAPKAPAREQGCDRRVFVQT